MLSLKQNGSEMEAEMKLRSGINSDQGNNETFSYMLEISLILLWGIRLRSSFLKNMITNAIN